MDAKAHGELHPFVALQARIQGCGDGLNNTQTSVEGTLGVILMRLGPAKVDEEAIPEILCDMAPLEFPLRRGFLVPPNG